MMTALTIIHILNIYTSSKELRNLVPFFEEFCILHLSIILNRLIHIKKTDQLSKKLKHLEHSSKDNFLKFSICLFVIIVAKMVCRKMLVLKKKSKL